MAHLLKLRTQSIFKWVSSNFIDSHSFPLWPEKFAEFYNMERTRRFSSLDESFIHKGQKGVRRISRKAVKGAQTALLEYLHQTRSIPFMDAENMSLNSPHFLEELLQKVDDNGSDIKLSVTRFLRYHPVNEFEPFLESLGLKPCELIPLLPRDLMFLSDDGLLLENYHALCNYGIPRNKIGKIYKEATEIFQYDCGVLVSKLEAYERLGLSQSFVYKAVACSPYLLIGDVNENFLKVLEILKRGGVGFDWIDRYWLETSYNWSHMLEILNLFRKEGYNEEQLGNVISQHPGILFENSEDKTLSLIVFLFKFGLSMNQICSMFQHLPHMEVWKVFSNLRKCFLFMSEIDMEANEMGKIFRSHPVLLGSWTLKKTNTLLAQLHVGKKRLREFICENPQEIKKLAMGKKIEPLPDTGEEQRSKMLKIQFILDIGLVEEPSKIENIVKVVRGRGSELQERCDCILKAGLDKKDVRKMLTQYPQILNQKKEVIEKKLNFLLNDLHHPISFLVAFPAYFNYTERRVKLRYVMYNWLKEQGTIVSVVALSTLIAIPETIFLKRYVKHHPRGLQVWQDLKNEIYSEN